MPPEEHEDAFEKIDALVSADKGEVVEPQDEVVILDDAPQPVDDVELGIEALKKQLEAEKTGRAEAERRAIEAANREKAAVSQSDESNLKLIDTAIATVVREKEKHRTDLREAMAVGDYDKAAEIQEAMMATAVNFDRLNQAKANYVNRPKQVPTPPADPIERFTQNMSQASAQWIRSHPEFVTNPAKQRDMIDAHKAAVDLNGLTADSPQYFKFVEDWVGIGAAPQRAAQTQVESPLSDAAATPPRRQTPPAAVPVSRSNAIGITNPTTVTLTAEEREIAELNGMTPKQYAQNKAELQKAGRIGGRGYN